MLPDVNFSKVNDDQFNLLMEGAHPQHSVPWSLRDTPVRLANNEFGVLWASTQSEASVARPLAVVVRREDQQRLFGRFAQLRSDLSPFSAWCHIVTPDRLDAMDDLGRDANLGDYAAAWTGLVVAEAMLLAERSVARIRIAACMATQTFAVARANALWSPPFQETIQKYDLAQTLFPSEHRRSPRIRSAFEPIWSVLATLSLGAVRPHDDRLLPLVEAIHLLHLARIHKDPDEATPFLRPLRNILPDELMNGLERLSSLSPEARVQAFDRSVSYLEKSQSPRERQIFAAVAGYLATIAAGGIPSLSLLTASAQQWPEITAWAYVLGGVGEPVVWTSSFDGLGRLVARELLRPVRFDEPPTSDFALDEALMIMDPQLSDPLVHLRIKQSELLPSQFIPGSTCPFLLAIKAEQRVRSCHAMKCLRIGSNPHHRVEIPWRCWPTLCGRICGKSCWTTMRAKRTTVPEQVGAGQARESFP